MSRDGLLLPAEEGARVDFFNPVLADIGDLQSVDEDLSTFSGHMLVCREVLANSGKNALVLMDELGSGTDPNVSERSIYRNEMKCFLFPHTTF
jgi:DNA mismatch repair protein MutS2